MFQVIKNNILHFFYMYCGQAVIFAFSVLAIVFLLNVIVCKCRKQEIRRISFGKWLLFAMLLFYVYMVCGITLFSRSETHTSFVNLQLFSTFYSGFMGRMYLYENILLFVPYAVLLYMWARPFRKLHCSLLLGTASSILIEIIQYLTSWGRCELDDIFTNTLGMLAGFMICRLVHTVWNMVCGNKVNIFSYGKR